MNTWQPYGVIPAHISPFQEDFQLDEPELRRHIRDLADTEGVTGIISNGHAGEVTSLTQKEYARVLEVVRDEVGENFPVISGVVCETAAAAVKQAILAKEAGADAILLFPPNLFQNGGTKTSELPYRYVSTIAEKADIPIFLFQFALESRCAYSTETLVQLVKKIPNIIAIKEGSNDLQRYEENYRAIKAVRSSVSILTTNNTKLLPSLAIGGDGIISGSGCIIAPLLVQLFQAVERNDLFAARESYARLFPVMQVFYAEPALNMHNRMKVALKLLERQTRAIVREPLMPLTSEEQEKIRCALIQSRLLPQDR
mgnify:CR=1 FL=1